MKFIDALEEMTLHMALAKTPREKEEAKSMEWYDAAHSRVTAPDPMHPDAGILDPQTLKAILNIIRAKHPGKTDAELLHLIRNALLKSREGQAEEMD